MTSRLFYNFRAPNEVRFTIALAMHNCPEGMELRRLSAVDLHDFLKGLVNNSELEHVSGPVEVEE